MFGTYENHTLRQAAFSREYSFWTIYEDFREPVLGVTVSKDGTFLDQRSNTFLLYPTYKGEKIPYTYFADVSHLEINTEYGKVEDVYKRQVRNLGRKSLEEVVHKLAMMGLSLTSDENS